MGTMVLDTDYFANNNVLCGIQIRLCPEDEDDGLLFPPPPPINTHEPWFLWEGVWIGSPIGLFAIKIMFGIGYFTLPPPSNRQYRPHCPIGVGGPHHPIGVRGRRN